MAAPLPHYKQTKFRRHAFTIIELMIVILIMAIIAGVLLSSVGNASSQAEQAVFAQDLRVYVRAAMRYEAEQSKSLEDSAVSVVPEGWDPYINRRHWTSATAIGGGWDVAQDIIGSHWAVGVDFSVFNDAGARDDTYMAEIDRLVDDGDLSAGSFRKISATQFYFLID